MLDYSKDKEMQLGAANFVTKMRFCRRKQKNRNSGKMRGLCCVQATNQSGTRFENCRLHPTYQPFRDLGRQLSVHEDYCTGVGCLSQFICTRVVCFDGSDRYFIFTEISD